MQTTDIAIGKTYSWTNNNHVNGPMTFVVTVTGVSDTRVTYRHANGLDGVSSRRDFVDMYR